MKISQGLSQGKQHAQLLTHHLVPLCLPLVEQVLIDGELPVDQRVISKELVVLRARLI